MCVHFSSISKGWYTTYFPVFSYYFLSFPKYG